VDLELGLIRKLGHREEGANVVALVALQLDNLSILGVLDDTAVASKLLQTYAHAEAAGESRRGRRGGRGVGGGGGREARENAMSVTAGGRDRGTQLVGGHRLKAKGRTCNHPSIASSSNGAAFDVDGTRKLKMSR